MVDNSGNQSLSDDEDNSDLNDSGVDFTPIRLKSPDDDVSLDWVTEMLNWIVEEDEKEGDMNADDEIPVVLIL